MRTRIACVVLLAVVQPAGAHAQTVSITEAEAVARLTSESPQVRAARAPIEVARADVLAAARWPNPRATFTREAAGGIAEQLVMASQVLPVTGRRSLGVAAAAARVDAASRTADEQLARLRADVRLAFTDLWLAQNREQELTRGRDRLQSLADVLARREAAGDAAGFDRLRAEREVMDTDVDCASAAAERGRAEAVLSGFFGSAPVGRLDAVTPPPSRAPVPSVEELVTGGMAARAGLVALQRELEASALDERLATRRRVPEPEVVAGTKSSGAGNGSVGSVFSVHVTLPLFDRAAPERATALALTARLQAERDLFIQQLRTQVASWRAAVVDRREIADRYRAVVSAGAEQLERIAQVSYDAGERSILELLDAYRITASARVRQVVLDAAVREAEIELEFLSGWESR